MRKGIRMKEKWKEWRRWIEIENRIVKKTQEGRRKRRVAYLLPVLPPDLSTSLSEDSVGFT